jgi:LPXTG-motif cell wall-anchored protein
MKSFIVSAALAALTLGPAVAQDSSSNTESTAPVPSVNVKVDAPAAPAPVQSTSSTVEKTTVVARESPSTGMDNTTLGVLAGLGIVGAACIVGLAASSRG